MIRYLIAGLTPLAFAASASAEQRSAVTEVEALEAAFYQAFLDADGESFRTIFSDDFTYQHGSGLTFTDEAFIELMTNGTVVVTVAETPKMSFRDFGDVVVSYGQGTVEGSMGGAPFGGTLRFVNVWHHNGAVWHLYHRNSEFLPTSDD